MNQKKFEKIASENNNKILNSNKKLEETMNVSNLSVEFYNEKTNRVKEDSEIKNRISKIEKNTKALQDILGNSLSEDKKNFQINIYDTSETNELIKELSNDLNVLKKEDISEMKEEINRIVSNVSNLIGLSGNENNSNVSQINNSINDLKNLIQDINVTVDNSNLINKINKVDVEVKNNNSILNKINSNVKNLSVKSESNNNKEAIENINLNVNEIKKDIKEINSFDNSLINTINSNLNMLSSKITSLENEITKNKNEDNKIENQEDQIEDKLFSPDTSIDSIPVVYFLPFAEVGYESDIKLQKAMRYGSKYKVNLLNPNDYSINSQNFVEKFLFYYNQGARLFVSKSWSSILSVLNEFFNNIEKTNPEVDMESFIYVDIGSTAPNLINKDGTIAPRNKYITRMIPNSIVSGEIMLRKFDEEISNFDECIIIYLNDPYGSYFGNLLNSPYPAELEYVGPPSAAADDEKVVGLKYNPKPAATSSFTTI